MDNVVVQSNSRNKYWALGLAGVFFLLYLFSMPPALAPYRDAGEMTSCVSTLGIVHPPGYPLYVMAGKVFSAFLPGNPAYRLNLFSALCGVSALACLCIVLSARFGLWPALFSCAMLGLNLTFWHVSSVSEMYSLNAFLAAVLLGLAWRLSEHYDSRRFFLLSFFYGLFLGNRMDLILYGPAVFIFIFPSMKERKCFTSDIFKGLGFFLLGAAVYLYLPLRAYQNPVLDWNHPAGLSSFIGSVTRKSYGGTLDLLSKNYAAGELFLPNIKYYLLHLYGNFSAAVLLSAAGLWLEFKRRPARASAFSAAFLVSGPLFLFLGNMPPNPHALAIVEPHYILPDLCVAAWMCAGLRYLAEFLGEKRNKIVPLYIACVLCAAWTAYRNVPASYRRWNLLAVDYAADCMRSCPPESWIIAKKDVQLFSLWNAQLADGKRSDLKVVAQGLSGSSWYQKAYPRLHPGFTTRHLLQEKPGQWRLFLAENGPVPVFATLDAEIPGGIKTVPRGMIQKVADEPEMTSDDNLWHLYSMRGFRASKDLPDFFSKDLADAYAQALTRSAIALSPLPGKEEQAVNRFRSAMSINGDQAEPPLYIGIIEGRRGNWAEALEFFGKSADIYDRLIKLTEEYHSLPSLKESVIKASADAYLNMGVALEKLGRREEAERAYVSATARNPLLPDAHYNLAVLYWNRDWSKVALELKETLRLNPNHPAAAQYLKRIEMREQAAGRR